MLAGLRLKKTMTNFNNNTYISIGLFITLVGLIFTLGQSYSRLEQHEEKIYRFALKLESQDEKLDAIRESLARIEERLKKTNG